MPKAGEHQRWLAPLIPVTFWSNTLSLVSPKEQHLPKAWKKCYLANKDESVEKQEGVWAVLGLGCCCQPRCSQVCPPPPPQCPGQAQGW